MGKRVICFDHLADTPLCIEAETLVDDLAWRAYLSRLTRHDVFQRLMCQDWPVSGHIDHTAQRLPGTLVNRSLVGESVLKLQGWEK